MNIVPITSQEQEDTTRVEQVVKKQTCADIFKKYLHMSNIFCIFVAYLI